MTLTATIGQLCQSRLLAEFQITLRRQEFASRRLYVTPAFISWIEGDVKNLPPPPLGVPSEYEEINARIRQYILGHPLHFRKQLGDVRCHVDYIWELKTRFSRIFGAFTAQDCFIAHYGTAKESLTPPNDYNHAARICVEHFDSIGLPHTRFVKGREPRNVLSDVDT